MNFSDLIEILACPQCGGRLTQKNTVLLVCCQDQRHQFPIEQDIIRFVHHDEPIRYDRHWYDYHAYNFNRSKLRDASDFVAWFLAKGDEDDFQNKYFLDVGCGDGNHLTFLPDNSVRIMLDYSYHSLRLVQKRYASLNGVFLIQGDANALPFRSNTIDYCYSYGCLNCLADPKIGIREIARVLKLEGECSIWGYGTNDKFVCQLLTLARRIYHVLKPEALRRLYTILLIPSLLVFRNSTDINPLHNSFKECQEIVSNNLVPEHLHLFYQKSWNDLVPKDLILIDNYSKPCGQKFKKRYV